MKKKTHIKSSTKCYYGHILPLCINPEKQIKRNQHTIERQRRGFYSCGCLEYYFAYDPNNATCKYCNKKQNEISMEKSQM